MRTEDDLRSAMSRLAEDPPDQDEVLTAVRHRSATRPTSIRPRLLVGVAVATALAAVAVPLGGRLLGDHPAISPSPSDQPAKSGWQQNYRLVPPPGFVVHSRAVTPEYSRESLSSPGIAATKPVTMCGLTVYPRGGFDVRLLPAAKEPVTVNGRPGWYGRFAHPDSLESPDAAPRIAWEYAAGSWAVVVCDGPSDAAADKRIAQRIATATTFAERKLAVPLSIGYLPAGVTVRSVGTLSGPILTSGKATVFAVEAQGEPKDRTVTVVYTKGSFVATANRPSGRKLTVGGRPATMSEGDGKGRGIAQLTVDGDGFQLRLETVRERLPDAERELIRIAESMKFADEPADESTWFDATVAIP